MQLLGDNRNVEQKTGCQHLHTIVEEIAPCIGSAELSNLKTFNDVDREFFIDEIARRNVLRTVQEIVHRSTAVRQAVSNGRLLVVGAMYAVKSGNIDFLMEHAQPTPLVAS